MSPGLLSASFLFLVIASISIAADASSYVPRDNILLNCGASGQANDTDSRIWTGDTGSKYGPSLDVAGPTASLQDSSVPQVPYVTARVFTSPYTFSFPLGPGRKYIRLHFYPSNYSTHAASDALFSVTSDSHTLLSNFSAYLTADSLNYAYLTREFSVNVSTGGLNLTFTPSTTHPRAYAFVNGIEIVSTPDIFGSANPMLVVGGGASVEYPIDRDWALETMYRLNVGGQSLSPAQDSGLFRSWNDDSPYIDGAAFGVTFSVDPNVTISYPSALPGYIAPSNVYSTARSMGPDAHVNLNYNLTWVLPVDAGFYYLLRFHFCEIQYPITMVNQRVFDIYVDNQTAQRGADVITWSSGIGIPVFKDYVVITAGSGQMEMRLALHPDTDTKPLLFDAILNGLEVFKLQNANGSLAGLNPPLRPEPGVHLGEVLDGKSMKPKSRTAAIAGGVAGGFAFLLALLCLTAICRCHKKKKKKKKGKKDAVSSEGPSGWLPLSLYGNSHSAASGKTNATGSYVSSLPANLCRHFSFAEIKAATKDFDESLILGVGGFGKTGPTLDNTHVSTVVKGSFGYLDPEYFRRQQLTEKSDVYSFGVVLFEVLCARPALNPSLPKEQVSLAEWAVHCQKKGTLDQIMDPYLKGKIAAQCFKKFAETANKCVADAGMERPPMGDVLWNLEFALQLQESAEENGSIGDGISDETASSVVMDGKKVADDPSSEPSTTATTISIGGRSVGSEDSDGLTPSAVFSQIMNPKGR
ncbi:hypothetical protein OPV22_029262 [Ensete ventricosum]|uniref:Protein kinase domain-containing protein n=1 Tax=Ensete ventricosum TaxID=4639 RepID=A0AAV8PX10_ENSVE|nr:hypothetical protein OPV22_029262 [Ensete ventricosum]